eukprot:TRINITY_DN2470_c0_g1_i1.p1 TRINITY_DN2470_c0_g1~~TRINITY_DN2470_c0_g1_i1.p1  ORF type:complete len:126 (+),score=26.56 TRINITY_DN2470_c0_g1_i1:238-615(+)
MGYFTYRSVVDLDALALLSEEEMQQTETVKSATQDLYLKLVQDDVKWCETYDKLYRVYFVCVDYVDLGYINQVYKEGSMKRREFVWVSAADLLGQDQRELEVPLFGRVLALENIFECFAEIRKEC